jgi:hypothetical protein
MSGGMGSDKRHRNSEHNDDMAQSSMKSNERECI